MIFIVFSWHDLVPPKQMKILDEKGNEVDDMIGPFDEDSTLVLICLVVGGRITSHWFHLEQSSLQIDFTSFR